MPAVPRNEFQTPNPGFEISNFKSRTLNLVFDLRLASILMRILITAGPTREAIDAVRYISNRSSGKMGAALVDAALRAGHEVSLIAGPITAAIATGIRRFDVETAAQMHEAVIREFPGHD